MLQNTLTREKMSILEEAALSNRRIISEVRAAVHSYLYQNKITDPIVVSQMERLLDMKSPFQQYRTELQRSRFVLMGIICRVMKDNKKDKLLKRLHAMVF